MDLDLVKEFGWFVTLAAVSLGLVLYAIMSSGSIDNKIKSFCTRNGFRKLTEAESNTLLQQVVHMENNSEYRYTIKRPMKTKVDGNPVYFFRKERRRHAKNLSVADEFLLILDKRFNLPFRLFIKPTRVKHGLATRLIRSFTGVKWDALPDDLVSMDLPRQYRQSNLLTAFGPEGATLFDLVDANLMSLILTAGDHGITSIDGRENLLSFDHPISSSYWDLDQVWLFVRNLIRLSQRLV